MVDYALLSRDLDAEVRRLRQAGVTVDEPRNGGRRRKDGQERAWQAFGLEVEVAPLPFVREDVTDPAPRVPPGPTRQ